MRRLAPILTVLGVVMAGPAPSQETIKTALGVPMTGDYAPYAEWQGARCMAEMINAEGGVNGTPIEVLVQDSGADTQTAISLAQRFLDEGVVMLGIIPFSDTMLPVSQIAAPYGVSIFQPQSTQVEMHAGIVTIFFTGVSPDPFTAAAAANCALEQGVQNSFCWPPTKVDPGPRGRPCGLARTTRSGWSTPLI